MIFRLKQKRLSTIFFKYALSAPKNIYTPRILAVDFPPRKYALSAPKNIVATRILAVDRFERFFLNNAMTRILAADRPFRGRYLHLAKIK